MNSEELKVNSENKGGMKFRYRSEDEMKESGVEWIGKIPKAWGVSKLKSLSTIVTGNTPSKNDESNYKDGYIPWIKPDNITDEFQITESKEKLTNIGLKQARLIPKNSALVCCIGTVGKIGVNEVECATNQQINSVIFNKEKWNNKFGIYALISSRCEHERNSNKVVVSILNKTQQGNIYMTVPYINEQQKIANFLDQKTAQFDSVISKKEALIQKLEEAKKSLISEVVTGKVKVVKRNHGYELVEREKDEMKDSGVEWLGDVPKEWEVKRLRFLGDLQNGISKSGEDFGFGYPFVSYSDVYKNMELPRMINGLVNSSLCDRKIYSVLEGDVFFTRTSETVEEIGFASTCLETIPDATFAGFLIRFRSFKDKLYKGFSKYYFRCDLNRKFFVKAMNLVTRASLSQNLLNNLAVALPSHEEQIEIYLALEIKIGGINCSINKLQDQIQKLKEAKQSLISEAVTGKIEILD